MDLKDHEKPRTYCLQPNITARYCVTNAGRLFVKNINPFDTVGGNAGDVNITAPSIRKNEEFVSIFDKTPSKESNKTPPKELVNESLTNYSFNNNYNEHMFMKEQYGDAFHGGNQTAYPQPMVSMSANAFNAQYTSCSRDLYRTPRCDHEFDFEDFNQDDNRKGALSTSEMLSDDDNNIADENGRRENNTCRRPSSNVYNHEVVYKIMQRNARLQKIVRKLVIEREREKQREAWNNYINDLKNKHRYYSNEPSRISPQYVPGDHNTPEMIDDFYNMRFNWRQTSPCQNLLADLYGAHDVTPSTTQNRRLQNCDSSIIPPDIGTFIYDNDRFCYPTCSQSSMLRLNKERQGYAYNWRTRPAGRNFRGCGVVDNNRQYGFDRIKSTAGSYPPVHMSHTRKPRGAPISIQTANLPLVNEEDCKDLTVSKSELPQNDKSVLHYTEATTSVPENTLNQNQDMTVLPLRQEYLRRLLHGDAPSTEKITKLDKDDNLAPHQCLSSNKLKPFKNKLVENTYDIQKPFKYHEDINELHDQRCFDEKFKNVTDNIIKLKQKILRSEEYTKLQSLATIEEKIDGLMKSMNSIMTEIQTKKDTLLSRRSTAVSACKMVTASRTILNRHSSDPYSCKNKEYVCAMVQHSSRSLTISGMVPSELRKHGETSISKMEKILLEEMKKSDKAKSEIEEILNLHEERSCSLQITFDIPTKERSTEVTASLSKASLDSDNKALMKQIPTPDPRAMTIAVNTDPLGWLALLRVSAQTVKRLLSFVPSVNYYSYLLSLPMLLPTRRCQTHYTCNICGAAFCQPSQLSNHVKQHNLGKTRDCCVCRHALDLKSARADLFRCRFCGQRFTRAYCCELHQQSCAQQLGRATDVTSSHMLLQ